MISSVYNYYLSQYAHKANARYDSHTRDQLKNTYSRLLKSNSVTPAYKIDISEDAQKYAIGLKETARELSNIADDLSDAENGQMAYKKSAKSSNPEIINVRYIGNSQSPDIPAFDINVSQLASNQINTGTFLKADSVLSEPGAYAFELNINSLTYEFEFNIDKSENVNDVQNKIARLINRSNIGLKAHVISDSLGNSALSVSSDSTGISNIRPTIFNIAGSNNSNSSANAALVDKLGLNHVTQYPSNAVFSVNGEEHTSPVNEFSINNAFELSFKGTTGDKPVTISLKNDSDAIAESICELVSGYNKLISFTSDDKNTKFTGNNKLLREFNTIAHSYSRMLLKGGLNINDDGAIKIDRESIVSAADNGTINDIFNSLNSFRKDIKEKADNVAINPMDYVNNKIIAYKDPRHPVNDPYNLSAYTGMMFNGYI